MRETVAGQDIERLESLIGYQAPFDMRRNYFEAQFDFVHSVSVLEHIAPNDLPAIIRNLHSSLKPGGMMVHQIDLRDHLDLTRNPLAFTSEGTDYDPCSDYDARGNGLRLPDWLQLFGDLRNAVTTCVEAHRLPKRMMPPRPAPSYARYAAEDLLVGEITLVTKRL